MVIATITRAIAVRARFLARSARALVRLCLVLSTWNAPLPMVHAHQIGATAGEVKSIALLKHVHEYHGEAELAGEGYLDWHIHWLLPCEWQAYPCHHRAPGEHGPDSNNQDQSLLSGGSAVPAKTATPAAAPDMGKPVWLSQLAELVVSQSPLASQAAKNGFAPLHFLASYARSASLCELLSIWRC